MIKNINSNHELFLRILGGYNEQQLYKKTKKLNINQNADFETVIKNLDKGLGKKTVDMYIFQFINERFRGEEPMRQKMFRIYKSRI